MSIIYTYIWIYIYIHFQLLTFPFIRTRCFRFVVYANGLGLFIQKISFRKIVFKKQKIQQRKYCGQTGSNGDGVAAMTFPAIGLPYPTKLLKALGKQQIFHPPCARYAVLQPSPCPHLPSPPSSSISSSPLFLSSIPSISLFFASLQ